MRDNAKSTHGDQDSATPSIMCLGLEAVPIRA